MTMDIQSVSTILVIVCMCGAGSQLTVPKFGGQINVILSSRKDILQFAATSDITLVSCFTMLLFELRDNRLSMNASSVVICIKSSASQWQIKICLRSSHQAQCSQNHRTREQ